MSFLEQKRNEFLFCFFVCFYGMNRTVLVVGVFLLVVLIFSLGSFRSTPKEHFLGNIAHSHDQETIFVSVASYRDKACLKTIAHMYEQAKFPARIYVGICEQNTSDANENCIPNNFKYFDNVRKLTIPNKEAKGPTYARYLCSTLYRGETYFCQIDSHTTFVKDWDSKVIDNLYQCPIPAVAILTGYPHDAANYSLDEASVPILCNSKFNGDGLPQFEASIKSAEDIANATSPFPVPFVAGGFLFGHGTLVGSVPFDPYLDHLFNGEEILHAARLWTSGYDFFTPKQNIVFHSYYRTGEAKFHEDIPTWHIKNKQSIQRARRILQLEKPPILPGSEPYALGTKRTIQAYWDFAGLDPATKTSKSKEKFC